MATVHTIAEKGFGTGTNDLYDRARPSYQPGPISHIRASVRGNAPFNVAEVGAGTGIFTRALLAHPDWKGAIKELIAVEPSDGMRDVFSKTVKGDGVATSVRDGTFDTTGIPDGWADVVIVAQAFHWCPDYDRASVEFARILKPNGVVALIWNLEDRDAAQWVSQLRERIEKHEGGSPQFRLGLWRKTFDTESYKKLFESPEEQVTPYDIPTTFDLTIDRAFSKSYISILSEEDKSSVKNDLQNILERGEGREWIDEEKKIFKYPYKTYVVVWRKK